MVDSNTKSQYNNTEENKVLQQRRFLKMKADAQAKNILKNRYILANLLKACVEEFRDCTIREIAEQYIENIVPDKRLDPVNLLNETPDNIRGRDSEDNSPEDGAIRFDIYFEAKLPGSSDRVALIINVEMQQDASPSYPLLPRAIYYASRMISSQKNTYWTHSDYHKILKVYSIWICPNVPASDSGFLNQYALSEQKICGDHALEAEEYDLLRIVTMGLNATESANQAIQMFSILFSERSTVEDRISILEKNGVPKTSKSQEEVKQMTQSYEDFCQQYKADMDRKFNEGIEQGIERGIERGIKRGIEQGIESQLLEIVHLYMTGHNISAEEACKRLFLNQEKTAFVLAKLNS